MSLSDCLLQYGFLFRWDFICKIPGYLLCFDICFTKFISVAQYWLKVRVFYSRNSVYQKTLTLNFRATNWNICVLVSYPEPLWVDMYVVMFMCALITASEFLIQKRSSVWAYVSQCKNEAFMNDGVEKEVSNNFL